MEKTRTDKKGWNIVNIYNINQNKGWLVNNLDYRKFGISEGLKLLLL